MSMPAASQLDVDRLSVSERLDLIATLWDSIPDALDALPVPAWHLKELESRLSAADAAPDAAIPWEDVRRELRGES
jgi:putative addiction module component (TIGR02574 family)